MFPESLPYSKAECHTITVMLSTFFACLGAFVLFSVLLYIAYFKPFYDAHKDCLKQHTDKEQQKSMTGEFTQNVMQLSMEERLRNSYVKHQDNKQRNRRPRASTICGNNLLHETGVLPRLIPTNKRTTDYELCQYEEEPRNHCRCRNCIITRIMRSRSTASLRPSLSLVHFEPCSTIV